MALMKIYTAEYTDKDGIVQYDFTFEAMNPKEAKYKAIRHKMYALPYPGSGRLKTIIKLTGNL
jgi:hypothetical protein